VSRTPWYARAALILSAPCLLLLGAAPQAGAAPGKEPPAPAASAADSASSDMAAAGGQVGRLAEAKGALGTYFDAATSQFVVVVPNSGRGSTLTSADVTVPGVTTRIERRAITQAAIDAVGDRIERRAFHPDAAKYAYGFYYDLRRGVLVVETNAPAAVMASATQSFPGKVDYRRGATERDSRQNDPPPHWGGASITSGGAVCSSGFVVRNGAGTRFMVTAAHCFGLGATVTSTGGGWNFGTVVSRGPFPTWDLELLGGASYGSYIYVGGATGVGSHMLGAADPIIGFNNYCRSGQTTFENCGQTVTSLSATFCDASGCTPSLIAYSGGGLSAGGDSGAPFYVAAVGGTGVGVHARGIHIARSGGTMYAERWNTVAAHFGVSIVT
jgi:hypothetical protein